MTSQLFLLSEAFYIQLRVFQHL